MSIVKLSVDKKQYGWVPGGSLILSGWRILSEGSTVNFEALDESGLPVSIDTAAYPRADVASLYPKFSDQQEELGFSVTVPDLMEFIRDHQKLSITVQSGSQKRVLFSRTTSQLKKEFYESTIKYHMDDVSCTEEEVVLRGWITDATGDCFPTFTDETGRDLSANVSRSLRRDVADVLGLDEYYQEHVWGFTFFMPRKEISGNTLLMKMENSYTSQTFRLALNRPIWMSAGAELLKPSMLLERSRKAKAQLKTRGMKGFMQYVLMGWLFPSREYESWLKQHRADRQKLQQQREETFPYEPLISFVIPIYNTPERYLRPLMDSILAQSYTNFEICLADGSTSSEPADFLNRQYAKEPRIHLLHLKENRGISENTNAAINMASGEFLVFSDHDDFLEPDALYEMVRLLNENPALDLIYTDEDLTDEEGKHFQSPRFKPDFNPDLLRSINYICHLTMVRTSLAKEIGLLRSSCDGAQDYDFLLRCIERTDRVGHIPRILYHWRAHGESTAENQDSKQYAIDAGMRSLTEHFSRLGYEAEITYSGIFILFQWKLALKQEPLVTILIPNKDHTDTLDICVQSIYDKTDYPNFEILVVENNSTEETTFNYYKKMQKMHENFRVVTYRGGFNYSAINNFGAEQARGDYILFLNNDTEVISPFWIREMLGLCQRENTAAVGAKLYYADNTVQHCGVVIGIGNFAGHILPFSTRQDPGYLGRLKAVQDISAVTAACILVKKSVFKEIGGFYEELAVSLNDVDLCLRMREKGYLVTLDPNVELYHYESRTRGYENTPEKQERFKKEILLFRKRWKGLLDQGDPYYNPNLSICAADCSLRKEGEIPQVWKNLFPDDAIPE